VLRHPFLIIILIDIIDNKPTFIGKVFKILQASLNIKRLFVFLICVNPHCLWNYELIVVTFFLKQFPCCIFNLHNILNLSRNIFLVEGGVCIPSLWHFFQICYSLFVVIVDAFTHRQHPHQNQYDDYLDFPVEATGSFFFQWVIRWYSFERGALFLRIGLHLTN
jgi:hypothetical protein